MAFALPRNQLLPTRCWAGTEATYLPSWVDIRQVSEMWRSRLCDLYWVNTTIWRYPELTRFERAKSINRYPPANGTAGFALSAVNGIRRFPSPPANTIDNTFFNAMVFALPVRLCSPRKKPGLPDPFTLEHILRKDYVR